MFNVQKLKFTLALQIRHILYIMKQLLTPAILLVILTLGACKKDAGTGGLATIKGKVYAYDYNAYGDLIDSGYIYDQEVFISYGNTGTQDDKTSTSYDGSFAFNWLQKGEYSIWVIGKCDSCTLGQTYTRQVVNINSRKETVEVPDLIISK